MDTQSKYHDINQVSFLFLPIIFISGSTCPTFNKVFINQNGKEQSYIYLKKKQ